MTETERHGLQAVPEDGKLNPVMVLESRPNNITGFAFYLILSYKEFHEERILPADFFAMDDTDRDLLIMKVAGEMKRRLAPILEAEDRLVVPR